MKPSFQNMCALLRKSEPNLSDIECIERCKEFGIVIDVPKDESFTLTSFSIVDYLNLNHNGEKRYSEQLQVIVTSDQFAELQKLAPTAFVTAIRSNVKSPRKPKDTAPNKAVID